MDRVLALCQSISQPPDITESSAGSSLSEALSYIQLEYSLIIIIIIIIIIIGLIIMVIVIINESVF